MNGLFDWVKGAFKTVLRDTEKSTNRLQVAAMVKAVCKEVPGDRDWSNRFKLSEFAAWRKLKDAPLELQAEAAVFCGMRTGFRNLRFGSWRKYWVLEAMASQLLRKKLPFTSGQLVPLIKKAAKFDHVQFSHIPLLPLIGAVEYICAGQPPPGSLTRALNAFLARIRSTSLKYGATQELTKLEARTLSVLDPKSGMASAIPSGSWLTLQINWLDHQTEKRRTAWQDLFEHAATSAGRSRPANKWLDTADQLIKTINRPHFSATVAEWLSAFKPDPEKPDASHNIVKGLMWMVLLLRDDALTLALGRATETSFKKVAGIGARSKKHGNAGIVALSLMGSNTMAVAELVRLKAQVKYPTVKAKIYEKLEQVAIKTGVCVSDLEESSLPDFGLDNTGQIAIGIGEAMARVQVNEEGVALSWLGTDGKPRKSVPAAVKRDHAEELKRLKQQAKDIEAARKTQITRLEDSWVWSAPVEWSSLNVSA